MIARKNSTSALQNRTINLCKRLCFCVACLCTIATIDAESYKPILSDGKSWIVEEVYLTFVQEHPLASRLIRYEVGENVTVNDKQAKTVRGEYLEEGHASFEYTFIEEDGKLYLYDVGWSYSLLPLIDMTLDLNEPVTDPYSSAEMKAIEVNAKTVNGSQRKELVMAYRSGTSISPDCVVATWVEGVESSSDDFIYPFPKPTGSYYYRHLLECYDNGELIFTNEDFSYPIAGIINPVTTEKRRTIRFLTFAGVASHHPAKARSISLPAERKSVIERF